MKCMKVFASLDGAGYSQKPSGNMIPTIKKRIPAGWQEIEIDELAYLVGEDGYAIMPAHLEGGLRAENCTAMQLFMLDFDHGIRFCDVRNKCEKLGLPIAFAYLTYSSSAQEERFRIVFVHDFLINDPFVAKVTMSMLHKIFRGCDSSCTNLDRIFFGGKKLICIDTEARFTLVQLLDLFFGALDVGDNLNRNIRTFCSSQRILTINGRPVMGPAGFLPSFREIDGFLEAAVIHTVGDSQNPSFFIAEKNKMHQSITCRRKVRKLNIGAREEALIFRAKLNLWTRYARRRKVAKSGTKKECTSRHFGHLKKQITKKY